MSIKDIAPNKDSIKRIFNKDLDAAFQSARDDERKICSAEKDDEQDREIRKLEGKYILEIKLLEQTNKSLLFQIKNIKEREKALDKKEQQIKEARIIQRRLASDLVSMAERKRDFDINLYQDFVRLEQDVINSESEIVQITHEKEKDK
jgi:hypothetical protein